MKRLSGLPGPWLIRTTGHSTPPKASALLVPVIPRSPAAAGALCESLARWAFSRRGAYGGRGPRRCAGRFKGNRRSGAPRPTRTAIVCGDYRPRWRRGKCERWHNRRDRGRRDPFGAGVRIGQDCAALGGRDAAGAFHHRARDNPARRVLVLIDVDADGLRLTPSNAWDITGGVTPHRWTLPPRPCGARFRRGASSRPAAGVVHIRAYVEPSAPWRGISPLTGASSTARLLAETEAALADESSGARGYVLPMPQAPASAPTPPPPTPTPPTRTL